MSVTYNLGQVVGSNAKINGFNVITLVAGEGIELSNDDNVFTISASNTSSDLYFTSVMVPVNSWTTNPSSIKYKYCASVPLQGVTGNDFAEVVFNESDASSGIFSPVVESMNGSVLISASEIPAGAITIPTIKVSKGG